MQQITEYKRLLLDCIHKRTILPAYDICKRSYEQTAFVCVSVSTSRNFCILDVQTEVC